MSDKSLVRTGFPDAVAEAMGFYVYRLIDPRNGRTFYVGKGAGNRVFQHVAEATGLPDRATLKLDLIREIESSGLAVRYIIHRHGLTEHEAYLVESSLIDAYEELTNAQLGHATHTLGLATVDDLVGRYDAGAADVDVPSVLLNLRHQYHRGLTPEQVYERTRGHWAMRPDRHAGVKYGMAFALGLIREVYRIESWSKTAVEDIAANEHRKPDDTESKSKYRWMFTGVVATDIRDRFVGKSVVWLSQNPIRWVNC
jgi:uncharacterized protein